MNRCIFPEWLLPVNMHIIWIRFEAGSALMINGRAYYFLCYSKMFVCLFVWFFLVFVFVFFIIIQEYYSDDSQHQKAGCKWMLQGKGQHVSA